MQWVRLGTELNGFFHRRGAVWRIKALWDAIGGHCVLIPAYFVSLFVKLHPAALFQISSAAKN